MEFPTYLLDPTEVTASCRSLRCWQAQSAGSTGTQRGVQAGAQTHRQAREACLWQRSRPSNVPQAFSPSMRTILHTFRAGRGWLGPWSVSRRCRLRLFTYTPLIRPNLHLLTAIHAFRQRETRPDQKRISRSLGGVSRGTTTRWASCRAVQSLGPTGRIAIPGLSLHRLGRLDSTSEAICRLTRRVVETRLPARLSGRSKMASLS